MLLESQKLRKVGCHSFIINRNYLVRMQILLLQPQMAIYLIETFHKNMQIGYFIESKKKSHDPIELFNAKTVKKPSS